jgi:hypothetical protein
LRLGTEQLSLPDEANKPIIKMAEFIYLNPLHFVKAASFKIFYLLLGVRPYYSHIHNLALILFLTLIYACSIVGYNYLTGNDIRIFAIATIMINCLLIGFSTVDWDNRFYIPMEPAVVILAAGGASRTASLLYGLLTRREQVH